MRRIALALILAVACAKPSVERADWQQMSAEEKTLYVQSLIGAEKVKERKEGNVRHIPRDVEAYVKEIDAAYARGDTRAPEAIFESVASR